MGRYAVIAVSVLATIFAKAALGDADDVLALEFDYGAIKPEKSTAVTVPTLRNVSKTAATIETETSIPFESTLPSELTSSEIDIENAAENRFFEILNRAVKDPELQRREVQVLTCCFPGDEEDCDRECVHHFVTSVDSGATVSNETVTMTVCRALYAMLDCSNETSSECMAFCRCFNSNPWADALWGVMSALFFVCMLLTLAVYACVPRLRNLHGKCLISYLVAVIAGEAVATAGSSLECGYPNPVAVAAVYYLTLVRYCWINLLCVDVYCTCQPFQSVRQTPRTGCFSRERRKLLYFSAAAWGVPALVSGLLHAFEDESTPMIYTCIIFVLLAASCVPLLLTLGRIWRTKRQTKKTCLGISRKKLNWFYLTSKLLCLSGAGKLLSVALYFILRGKPYYNWLFAVLKLEGPIMLFLFVCNVRVRGLVRQRLTHLEWISAEKSNDNCNNNN